MPLMTTLLASAPNWPDTRTGELVKNAPGSGSSMVSVEGSVSASNTAARTEDSGPPRTVSSSWFVAASVTFDTKVRFCAPVRPASMSTPLKRTVPSASVPTMSTTSTATLPAAASGANSSDLDTGSGPAWT
ncbi:hypothetical protein COEX109129_10085 [Corallococcus exiguus]